MDVKVDVLIYIKNSGIVGPERVVVMQFIQPG